MVAMATASSGMLNLLQLGIKIVAVGRNYVSYSKELRNAVPKKMEGPLRFPTAGGFASSLGGACGRKLEMYLKPRPWIMLEYSGYALALDMTAREIQSFAKSAGLPWTVAKRQDTFAPISSVALHKAGQKITAGITGLLDVHFNIEKRQRRESISA